MPSASASFHHALLAGAFACLPGVGAAAACPPSPAPCIARACSTGEGLSPVRLERLDAFLASATRPGGYLGAVALVARGEGPARVCAYGSSDLGRTREMAPDAIFRIYSMTKTMATVAVLMLVEEGRLGLDDPVAAHLPQFAGLQVADGASTGAARLRPPARPLTIRHLLTHTAGFATAADDPAHDVLQAVELERARDLADYAQRVARVPLAADPGSRFAYDGVQIEVASRIVEVVGGQPLDAFLQERLFAPLGMQDTGFSVPAAQRHRVVDISRMGADGRLVLDDGPSARRPGDPLRPYASGAGGLYSTADDVHRFARMLLEGGRVGPTRLLARKTVDLMMRDHLAGLPVPVRGLGEGETFGLGGSVLLDPARRGRLGSVGQFGWSGAASTYFTVDRSEGLVAVLLLQHLPGDAPGELPRLAPRFYNLVYQAVE